MWYVYVLKSLKDGRLYTGTTSDLKRRLNEHINRLVIRWTVMQRISLFHFGNMSAHDQVIFEPNAGGSTQPYEVALVN